MPNTETEWDALIVLAYPESRDAERFQAARNPTMSALHLQAYQCGYEAGWRAAIAAARGIARRKG